LIIAVIIIYIYLAKNKSNDQQNYPYIKIDELFSPAERSFLGVLQQVIGEEGEIFAKVRVADVIKPTKGMSRSLWQTAFNKISAKHFDYVICDKNDLSILCVIELNDSSHNSKKRIARDQFLEGACTAAGLPLIQIKAQASYNIDEMKLILMDSLMHTDTEIPSTR